MSGPHQAEDEALRRAAGAEEPAAAETPTEAAAADPVPQAGEPPANGDAGSPAVETAPAEPVVPEEDQLTAAARQRDEYLALAQRTQADFDNYRRRAARDVSAAGARTKVALLRELLPVVDNLERALATAGAGDEGLASGIGLVHSELVSVLRRSGVAAIEPAGERFDPNVHEAISTAPADGNEAGLVVDVVEKGYAIGDSVIRPARVVVSA